MITKTKISDRVLKTIDEKKIKPIPRWEFVSRDWSLRLVVTVGLVGLAVASGLMWWGLKEEMIDAWRWLLGVIISGALAVLIWRQSKRAYLIEMKWVIGALVVGGLIIGGLIYQSGLAARIDNDLEGKVPYYRQLVPLKAKRWNNPVEGRLAGKINKIMTDKRLELIDFNGEVWEVDFGASLIRGRVKLMAGEEIKLFGQIKNEVFEANEIRPWVGRRSN